MAKGRKRVPRQACCHYGIEQQVMMRKRVGLILFLLGWLWNLPATGPLLAQGDLSFRDTRRDYWVGPDARAIALGDFNGDGLADLATANARSNDVSVLLGRGDGTFAAPRNFAVGQFPI